MDRGEEFLPVGEDVVLPAFDVDLHRHPRRLGVRDVGTALPGRGLWVSVRNLSQHLGQERIE